MWDFVNQGGRSAGGMGFDEGQLRFYLSNLFE